MDQSENRIYRGEVFSRPEDRALPALVPPASATPMSMVAFAVQKGMDHATIKDLMELQERYEANEARKAFGDAMAAFKLKPPEIHKNKQVRFQTSKGVTEYKHATLDEVAVAIGAALAPHGLKHAWNVVQKEGGMIDVTCILSHRQGHSEHVTLSASKDDSGTKNNIQALGSTITYLQRYTLLAVTGMAVKDQDDDGKTAEKPAAPEPDPAGKAALEACGSMASLAEAWKALTAQQRATLAEVKNECKARIQEADKTAQS